MRSQAIPIATYRRRVLIGQVGPPALAATLATIIFTIGLAVWQYLVLPGITPQHFFHDSPLRSMFQTAPGPAVEKSAAAEGFLLPPVIGESSILAEGRASLGGVGGNSLKNMRIAIGFVDGEVIYPGQQFSFDDVARSWDYKEHPSYVPSLATSSRGPIMMRGGGVCWVSTALWRAALTAGLATDVRENHYGFVAPLGAGLDATNTLVIRNNSSVPITVRAWEESGSVAVALVADGELDRKGVVSGPQQLGRGSWVATQTVYWDDGDVTTHSFYSRYYW
jgi:vancomycin resistance protein YoaR